MLGSQQRKSFAEQIILTGAGCGMQVRDHAAQQRWLAARAADPRTAHSE